MLCINWNIVLQNIDWIFGFLVGRRSFRCIDDDIGDSVSKLGCVASVPLLHLVGKLDVRLLGLVLVIRLGQLLGDHQLADVNPVAEQIRDGLLHKIDGAVGISLDGNGRSSWKFGSEGSIFGLAVD